MCTYVSFFDNIDDEDDNDDVNKDLNDTLFTIIDDLAYLLENLATWGLITLDNLIFPEVSLRNDFSETVRILEYCENISFTTKNKKDFLITADCVIQRLPGCAINLGCVWR